MYCCSIFPSAQEPGTIQIPIGNNTGSLPDLTSFQFSSPLPTPLDQEDHTGSPYSNVSHGINEENKALDTRKCVFLYSFKSHCISLLHLIKSSFKTQILNHHWNFIFKWKITADCIICVVGLRVVLGILQYLNLNERIGIEDRSIKLIKSGSGGQFSFYLRRLILF